MTTPSRLECVDLTRRLRSGNTDLTVLDRVSLAFEASESTAIVGPSGSGKSTLLGLLAGLDRPTSGEVRIDGKRIDDLGEDALSRLRRDRIGFVFQSFQLMPNLTAHENVRVPLELNGVRDAASRASALLDRMGLSDRTTHYPSQLSGGEQQRVAIARAFAPSPDLLFADEPTGNLDAATGELVLELLFELQNDEGATLIMVTHDDAVAARADRQIQLQAGQVVSNSGSARDTDELRAQTKNAGTEREQVGTEPSDATS